MIKKFVVFLSLAVILVVSACGGRATKTPLSAVATENIPSDNVPREIIDIVINEVAQTSDAPYGLKVYAYPELLVKGTVITSYASWTKQEDKSVICETDCWFFWFDDDPMAQFAHKTRYVIVDDSSKEWKAWEEDWWPVINDKEMWATTDLRNAKDNVVYEIPAKLDLNPDWFHDFSKIPQAAPGCEVWAILVCGSNDPGNTFDEDVRFWYDTLIALGYTDDHIFYVSPFITDPGVDRVTNLANVQWAINQVAANTDAEDKVLFYYSAHGDVDSLQCYPGSPGGGYVSANDMDNWLDTITSREMTVMLQGCRTGSYIGRYSDGSEVPAENDLTGDGETNRIVMTATDTDHSSYGGSSTWGSTFTGGYIASFSDAAADVDGNSMLSVDEGYTYALAHDSAALNGWSFPQMDPSSLLPEEIFHTCSSIDAWISDGPNDTGNNSYDYDSTDIWSSIMPGGTIHDDPVSGLTNYAHVRVHNIGSVTATNVDVALYWGDSSTALAWPADFNQIGSVYTIPSIPAGGSVEYSWPWYVDPAFGLGHHFCFVATADTPADPMSPPSGMTFVAPFDNNIAQKNITIVEAAAGQSADAQFFIENNTKEETSVELVIDKSLIPEMGLMLAFPDKLTQQIMANPDNLKSFEFVEQKGMELPVLLALPEKEAAISRLILEPMEKSLVSLKFVIPGNAKPGQEFTFRILQKIKGEIVGVNTFVIRVVQPGDCNMVLKQSAEVFAQIGFRFKSDSAIKLVELVGNGLLNELCLDGKATTEWVRESVELERKVADEIKGQAPAVALRVYVAAVSSLETALKEGDAEKTLLAQQAVVDAAAALVE